MERSLICNEKLSKAVSDAMSNVWNSLTKEELLEYMSAAPDITADAIRQMFINSNVEIIPTVVFSTAEGTVKVQMSSEE